jgi:hypothetical protein
MYSLRDVYLRNIEMYIEILNSFLRSVDYDDDEVYLNFNKIMTYYSFFIQAKMA